MRNFIIKLLDLEPESVENIDIRKVGKENHLVISLKRTPQTCPACFKMTSKVKEYKYRRYSHQIIDSQETYVFYRQRRMVCPYCGKTFNERSTFGKAYSSITNTTLIAILENLRHYTATYTKIADKYAISVRTVIRIFDNHVQIRRHHLTDIICIDEFYFNRHSRYKYAFMIMSFRNKLILDIVESRRQETLSDYFHSIPLMERKSVKYVSMDMYRPYKDICAMYLPNASICIDSFHVMKKMSDSLNSLRKRIMRRHAEDKNSVEYRLLKYRYRILLKSRDDIDDHHHFTDRILGYTTTESGVLECILAIDDSLKAAYHLKEDYRLFNAIGEQEYDRRTHDKVLCSLTDAMITSNIKEMKNAGLTIRNWHDEIMNSFMWIDGRRISNGCIEGRNNYAKKILSNANGMSNFQRARNRIMYSQNKYERYSFSVFEKRIDKPNGDK